MHGCGWDSGAARERSSALAASVASRYALGADGVGAARPGARGSRVTASRYALGAEGGGAARPGAYMCPPRNCARCLLGGVGMSKKSCAARCSRGSVQGVLRAPAEGEGGVAHREDLAATASATLERSTGTVAHGKRAARERRRRRSQVSRRRRAGHAPPARRGRRVRVPRAFKRPAKTLWWWWWWWQQLRITSGRLPLIGGSIFLLLKSSAELRGGAQCGEAQVDPRHRQIAPDEGAARPKREEPAGGSGSARCDTRLQALSNPGPRWPAVARDRANTHALCAP